MLSRIPLWKSIPHDALKKMYALKKCRPWKKKILRTSVTGPTKFKRQ